MSFFFGILNAVDLCYSNPCNDTAGECKREFDDDWNHTGYECSCYEGFKNSKDGKTCVGMYNADW